MKRLLFNLTHVKDYLTGTPVFELDYYRESVLARLMNLFAYVDLDKWKDMQVLEVGAGFGHIGGIFTQLGFDVTSTDGRPEHVAHMQKRGRKAFVLDLDATGVDEAGEFDLILAFGVLYHLAEPERFLHSCGKKAKILVLETSVSDSFESIIKPIPEKAQGWRGQDQALSSLGCRPSPAWIETTCRAAGFSKIRDVSSAIGNWELGRFDWERRGTNESRRDGVNLRKMWVCEKDSKNGQQDSI
jgi:SAM-dependent methyltransferase